MFIASLVFLSVANGISKARLQECFFVEPKKLTSLLVILKKLLKSITFRQPISIFFEKKKLQVFRKINDYIIEIFMDHNSADVGAEYNQAIYLCRLMTLLIWNRLAEIKEDYRRTVRSKLMVKD